MIILGIETSCDETAAAVLQTAHGRFDIRSHVVASQVDTHKATGGVVPEVAAREHMMTILPTIQEALKKANTDPKKLDAIGVTSGPGLLTSLLVGVETAKTLAYSWNVPLVRVNHIEGHIAANWLEPDFKPKFPLLVLVVSGGHTELILMSNYGRYKKIGGTKDDAAGETFDKVAKLLGLSYPGGPEISRAAEKGNPEAYDFPRPMLNHKNFDFSFSGLKTAVMYKVRSFASLRMTKEQISNIAASFQRAVTDVLTEKTLRAAKKYKVKGVLLSGGVAANTQLRNTFEKRIAKELPGTLYAQPRPKYCTDNAAMIAVAAYFHARKKDFTPPTKLKADANWELIKAA